MEASIKKPEWFPKVIDANGTVEDVDIKASEFMDWWLSEAYPFVEKYKDAVDALYFVRLKSFDKLIKEHAGQVLIKLGERENP